MIHSDYDGDGLADIAVWHLEEMGYYVKRSSDRATMSQRIDVKGKVKPVVGDVDGDGRAGFGAYGGRFRKAEDSIKPKWEGSN